MRTIHHQVADMADPKHLALHGLKLKGRDIVSDDAEEMKLGELTEEQWIKVQGKQDSHNK